jgi:hypothetical protein
VRRREWVRYIEDKYALTLAHRRCDLALDELFATQSEIETIKYDLVRYEAFRAGEPILTYKGRFGGCYIVDGHTRARVRWDIGDKTTPAILLTSSNLDICAELNRIAVEVGGGREQHIWDVPVTDRVGKGTEAWQARRAELLAEWHAELEQADRELDY